MKSVLPGAEFPFYSLIFGPLSSVISLLVLHTKKSKNLSLKRLWVSDLGLHYAELLPENKLIANVSAKKTIANYVWQKMSSFFTLGDALRSWRNKQFHLRSLAPIMAVAFSILRKHLWFKYLYLIHQVHESIKKK